MTTRIVASQISVTTANVGQYLVATANGVAGFGVVASARAIGTALVFN